MPGAHLKNKPLAADHFSDCNEESQLELHLQKQLQEDVARIFDESIYSDLEVVCGKLKILTHSCILKARTHNFFHKLHAILNVNIERSTFDEIYSFISDVYTECDIQHEEKEIITYLERHFSIIDTDASKLHQTKVEPDEPEVFLTPKCITPYVEKDVQKVINSSPNTELTREYYALVPIESNLLDKELNEQDALSNAFYSIIKNQIKGSNQDNILQRNKPTSLSLTSSHTSKTVKHSSSCDILNKNCVRGTSCPNVNSSINTVSGQDLKSDKITSQSVTAGKSITRSDSGADKQLDTAYSPDSLVTDDPSSSSDYLSAAYTFSVQVNAEINASRMEDNYTLSDSGLEDTGMLGSVSSHNDVTLTNVSLSENTLHDIIGDDASISALSMPSSMPDIDNSQRNKITDIYDIDCNGTNNSLTADLSGKSLKEAKQRQNEEIAILGSSSLSSETGSWESVYPPKFAEKEMCEKFLYNERNNYLEESSNKLLQRTLSPSLVQKSPYKSTSCFIDASSLVDEEETISITNTLRDIQSEQNVNIPAPSQPLPCATAKVDFSPGDWSEGNENDDSLEQGEKKDPDSIQRDLSPTIFEMTPITEDSLCSHPFENETHSAPAPVAESDDCVNYQSISSDKDRTSNNVFVSCTPNNSIMSLKPAYKRYESEDSDGASTVVGSEGVQRKQRKGSSSPPIVSGGASVQDHLPQVGSSHESSPLPKYKLENVPIVTGAYLPNAENDSVRVKSRTNSASAWVVDMSTDTSTTQSADESNTKHSDESIAEKKNIFSMYIELGEKSTVKEMPSRLSSSHPKKNTSTSDKPALKHPSVVAVSNSISKEVLDSRSIFEKYETLCNDPNISISEIIAIPEKIKNVNETEAVPETKPNVNEVKLSQKAKPESKDLFVKLSDLDKPVQKPDISLNDDNKVVDYKEIDVRMTRSIPDQHWVDPAFSNNSRSIEVISSFHSENALSLNRLFPHLKNEFSRSMPGSLSSRTRSPLRLGTSSTLGDPEDPVSDMSEVSSMQSSNCRSGFGNSTTDSQTSNLIENCTSRLGQDLLRMFLEEISPDVIVEVSGKRFKAHKCILSSRCQYFAGILSGGWVESLGNVIVLPPFSYNVVYFALCHIYSGLATIPDSVSIVELATIADMLGLEGLKEAIMFTLKAKYCHHFHKPCSLCIVGVLECFPLSSVYGLDDLYHKCLKWIAKYFPKVWPTKTFATLPTDLLDKCYQYHIVNLSIDNFVDTVYGCGITASCLQNSRWAESVARMCRRLMTAAAQFAAPRLVAVLRALAPRPAPAAPPARLALHDCLAAAIDWAPPDEATRAYAFLSTINHPRRPYAKPDLISDGAETDPSQTDSLLHAHAPSWRLQCEGALVRASPRVVNTQAFKDLPSDLRKRLRELGCIKYGSAAIPNIPPSQTQEKKSSKRTSQPRTKAPSSTMSRNIDIAQVRASFVPYAPKPMIPLGSLDTLKSNNDLRDSRKSMAASHPPKVRTTKAQEERAKFNKTKNTSSQDHLNVKSNNRGPSFEKTKPRYLEPKVVKDKKPGVVNKHLPKITSSSESSRNVSPVQRRRAGVGGGGGGVRRAGAEAHMSQDSLASRPRTAEPSTDSLSESINTDKYATYTKARHTKGSVESVKVARQNENASVSNNKKRTKIPVYLNQTASYKNGEHRNSKELSVRRTPFTKMELNTSERKVPGSLMNATKSSSAKIVPKIVKDTSSKSTPKSQRSTHTSRQQHHTEGKDLPKDIPMMERSGTFLKDEPTFGDKTTSIDIDKSME